MIIRPSVRICPAINIDGRNISINGAFIWIETRVIWDCKTSTSWFVFTCWLALINVRWMFKVFVNFAWITHNLTSRPTESVTNKFEFCSNFLEMKKMKCKKNIRQWRTINFNFSNLIVLLHPNLPTVVIVGASVVVVVGTVVVVVADVDTNWRKHIKRKMYLV